MGEHRSTGAVQVTPAGWLARCVCGATGEGRSAGAAQEALQRHLDEQRCAARSDLVGHLLNAAAHLSRARRLAGTDTLLGEAIGLDVDDVHRLLTTIGRSAVEITPDGD